MTLPAQVSPIAPGQILHGRFQVSGDPVVDGFGQVLTALDQKTGRPVTLRFLPASWVPSARDQLKRLGSFNHGNVVPTFGVVALESGDALLVQGPLAGRNLAEYVQHRVAGGKPVSLRGAYNVVAHVCNALTAIHANFGAHGAVRPGSVWINDDGRVQLSDLVLARALLGQGGTGGLPESDVAYLAPELKAGVAPVPASDIFGLGALLYVLLTSRSPMEDFVPPSQVHRDATPQLDGELFRALAPDPAQRHGSPEEFRANLLAVMGNTSKETTEDFGVDIEVEVNLASVAPRAGSSVPPAAIPGPPRVPSVDRISGAPQVGTRVSLAEEFRVSVAVDDAEAEAARRRTSLGEVDLKDVLAKITEDDAPRWMVVKNGMDHGPFSGRQLVNAIVQGEALREHELLNTDTGQRGKIGDFPEFHEFLSQYELRRAEVERARALENAKSSDKVSARFKLLTGLAALAVIALGGGFYALTRAGAGRDKSGTESDDLYKRGQLEISGSAGILPVPRGGGRRGGGGGGGGGGGMSYEDAMMQAVDIGSATGGGEQTLSPQTVAGVMNKNLNGIYGACVHGSAGTVKIDMAISGSGQVLGVSVNGGDPGLQRCVAEQVRRIRFPSFSAPRMGARFTFGT